jgi:rubrerythrin
MKKRTGMNKFKKYLHVISSQGGREHSYYCEECYESWESIEEGYACPFCDSTFIISIGKK